MGIPAAIPLPDAPRGKSRAAGSNPFMDWQPLVDEQSDAIEPALEALGPKIGMGNKKVLHYGTGLFSLCAEYYCNHLHINLVLVLVAAYPSKYLSPEPHLEITAGLRMRVIMGMAKALRITPWTPIEEVAELLRDFTMARKPAYMICMFGRAATADGAKEVDEVLSLPPNPGEDPARHTLSGILKVLSHGTKDDKVKMILDLHRRHFHKSAEELRNVLRRAGVPANTLALVETALALCVDCRRWRAGAPQKSRCP